jgi:leader peptidase (prepilin peptidase)/N-methyltransferase
MPLLFPAWSCLFGFLFGAFVGSFLNMAIYRLPRGLSFNEPKRSFCPKCEHSLSSRDLVPIASWLLSKGRCRYCQEQVAPRYFWVEVLTGSLFAGIWWTYLTNAYDPLRAGFYALTAAALVTVIFIDGELFIIPDELNAFLLVVAVAYHGFNHSLHTALIGGLLGWGLLFGITLLGRIGFGKDAMGDGDIKMMRGVGALLGPWLLLGNLAIAVVAGLIGGIAGILISRSKAAKDPVVEAAEEEEFPPPTPIPHVIIAGTMYLLCIDVFALVIPPLRRWIDSKFPNETLEDIEESDWKPTPTTIPFGPYLAVGALACMLFAATIGHFLRAYFHRG